MHAKFMHELCSLLFHIPTYLHVMICYNHVLHWFWGFSKHFSLLVLTLSGRKHFFLAFLTFQELCDSKRARLESTGWKLPGEKWENLGHQEVNRLQTRPGGAISQPGHATSTHLRLEPPMSPVYAWFCSSWPKNKCKKGPWAFPRAGGRNMKYTK
jgi:hypothetical protein